MPTPYLIEHTPARRQFRERLARVTGCVVIHTAESSPDIVGPDDGCLNVARFIENRSDPGSYHGLGDSDSRLRLVPFHLAAYGDGTGSNEFGIHLSLATQAARWKTLPREWQDGAVKQLALEARDAARFVQRTEGVTIPARRITRAQSEAGLPGFISHGERDPARRSDPGADFPWPLFLAEYARLMAPPVAIPPPAKPTKTRGKRTDAALKAVNVALDAARSAAKKVKLTRARDALRSIKQRPKG